MRTRGGHTKEPCKTTYNVDFLIHPYSTYFNGTINHAVFVQLLVGLYNRVNSKIIILPRVQEPVK